MNPEEVQALFRELHVWSKNGQRAPHKPFLALWAIGRCLKGQDRMVPYAEAAPVLTGLLRRFGPPRKTIHPEFPFWRLQSEAGLWEVQAKAPITVTSSGDAHVSSLRKANAEGGFTAGVHDALKSDASLAVDIAAALVEAHFPSTLHDEVLTAVGLAAAGYEVVQRRRRDAAFSARVLEAYRHRCAVCEYAVRLRERPVAIDGAHIKWHGAHGPDEVRNGLSLCATHHRLFDAGAFTVSLRYRVVVSPDAGGNGFEAALGQFSKRRVQAPHRKADWPDPHFLKWHHREVFASGAKYATAA